MDKDDSRGVSLEEFMEFWKEEVRGEGGHSRRRPVRTVLAAVRTLV